DEFVGELVEPHPELRTVGVHKQRAHYDVDGCSVALTALRDDGASTRTLTVEAADPAVVTAVVDRLGLTGRRNVSVARGLKELVGVGLARPALIRVCTNSRQ